jgi:hypothetical protein
MARFETAKERAHLAVDEKGPKGSNKKAKHG